MNLNELIVNQIVDVLPVFQPQGKKITIENRKSYALSFCKSGKITYTHNGKTYQSNKNTVVFHPQGQNYLLNCTENGEFPLIEFYLNGNPINYFMQFQISSLSIFFDLFNQMRENLNLQNKKAKNFSLLYEIFHLLENDQSNKNNNLLTPAVEYINNNYHDSDLSVSSLSKVCHVSECYFRRLFKQKYNISPKQYILSLKINKAKQLLKEGNLSVSQISDFCGFNNVFYFSKTFKSITHSTPSEFMKLNVKRTI